MAKACESPFEAGTNCKACRTLDGGQGARLCNLIVAESAAMQQLLTRAMVVADTEAPVVLAGESGAGKELVARAIHANSPRAGRPFLAINCAALPPDLLESELFGHARGAFTGAVTARRGLFETANGGTLLLDEVVEMSMPLQAKLLRALQDGEIRRVGESQSFKVDVRVLCASHEDLAQAVRDRRFREDLYFRLKVFRLEVPPLRSRRADIVPLARQLLSKHGHPTGRITPQALRALESWPWPGNVRELSNAVLHGAALSRGAPVELSHLPEELLTPGKAGLRPGLLSRNDEPLPTLLKVESEHIERVLEACGGRSGDAAKVLGIGRTTLWRKLRQHGLA